MRLEDQLRGKIRLRQMSLRTEESYVQWYRRYVRFHGKRHPGEMGKVEIEKFLTYLAVERRVAPSTQNQALNALLFLYREVLETKVEGVDAFRAKEKPNLPVVLTQDEIKTVLAPLQGAVGCAVRLLYGCGLRVNECLRLRIKDVDFEAGIIRVHDGKGGKDRALTMPEKLRDELKGCVSAARILHESDRAAGVAGVYLPHAASEKAPEWSTRWRHK